LAGQFSEDTGRREGHRARRQSHGDLRASHAATRGRPPKRSCFSHAEQQSVIPSDGLLREQSCRLTDKVNHAGNVFVPWLCRNKSEVVRKALYVISVGGSVDGRQGWVGFFGRSLLFGAAYRPCQDTSLVVLHRLVLSQAKSVNVHAINTALAAGSLATELSQKQCGVLRAFVGQGGQRWRPG